MQSSSDRLRKISKNDLEKLGLNGLAYIRPIVVDNETVFSVHAADGSRLGVVPTMEVAMIGLEQGNLHAVLLQ